MWAFTEVADCILQINMWWLDGAQKPVIINYSQLIWIRLYPECPHLNADFVVIFILMSRLASSGLSWPPKQILELLKLLRPVSLNKNQESLEVWFVDTIIKTHFMYGTLKYLGFDHSDDQDSECLTSKCLKGNSEGITKVSRLPPLGTMNVRTYVCVCNTFICTWIHMNDLAQMSHQIPFQVHPSY